MFEKAYGEARREPPDANRVGTRFNIASVEKIFTAVVVFQLIEERDHYGYGVMTDLINGLRYFGHDGGIWGSNAVLPIQRRGRRVGQCVTRPCAQQLSLRACQRRRQRRLGRDDQFRPP